MTDHSAADDVAYFAADLGLTRLIAVSTVPAQLATADGPLAPGRYAVFIDDCVGLGKAWVRTGPWNGGAVLPVTAGIPWFPMCQGGLVFVEFHVRQGVNDQIAVVSSVGTANLYITGISRDL